MRVAIVGAGLFGCIIGETLQSNGAKVTLFDSKEKGRASIASGCIMNPNWFKIPEQDKAFSLLDTLYGLQEIEFKQSGKTVLVYRANRSKILRSDFLEVRPEKITDYRGLLNGYDRVILAMGIWTPVNGIVGKTGISFTWKETKLGQATIESWAPYKQVVAFRIPENGDTWGGDGSAILEKNWTAQRENECLARVSKVVRPNDQPKRFVGIRPFVKTDKPCLIVQKAPKIWAVTGGAKNGTIAAAWAANELIKRI